MRIPETVSLAILLLFTGDVTPLISNVDDSSAGEGFITLSNTEPPDYQAYAGLKIPPLHPEEALERFELEDGFRIELVAHEPLIYDPVAMDIDADGRLWVVDMPSYMPVHDRSDWETSIREQVPQGRVVVLEDVNGDGKMDRSRVFYDELILPRAIKVLLDGVLVAEPPYVWLIRDTSGDGRGDTREIVYEGYGNPRSDNVEHMPNGLMWGIDNWLHSSHSGVDSLKRVDGEWLTRPFGRIGQWGITQDDWGRVYSPHNARPLRTHLPPYGYGERHPRFTVRYGKDVNIVPSEPMWPAHRTGVNRGYRIGEEVREDGTLRRATATGGAVIYRGDQFGDEYQGNAFIPEPAGNLIKRAILEGDPAEIEVTGRFAYEGREFLTSTDERFRPVNMYNSPDGALYVVDLYRGIFQHARFLTDHLRDYAVEHDLHKPEADFGRIYRIVREDREIDYRPPALSHAGPSELVESLRHNNGFFRDLAQQVLVQRSPSDAIPLLSALARNEAEDPRTRFQALWTLDGFSRDVYAPDSLVALALAALEDPHPRVRSAAVRILEPAIAENAGDVLERLDALSRTEASPFVQLQMVASLGESGHDKALEAIARILDQNVQSRYFREMALTGLHLRESRMAEILRRHPEWSQAESGARAAFLETLAEAETGVPEDDLDHLSEEQQVLFASGAQHYRTCAACHGEDGFGIDGLGSPLAGSDWVRGDPGKLIRIVLNGFDGEDENIGAIMPPHSFMDDDAIAAVLTFIRQSWGNNADPVSPEEVNRIRDETDGRFAIWSAEELRELAE